MKKVTAYIAMIIGITILVSCAPVSDDITSMKSQNSGQGTAPAESPTQTDADETAQQTVNGETAETSPTLAHEPTPEPTAEPTPAPTPEPTPEPKTFAQLAPTTTMPFAELVGDDGIYDEITRYPAPDTYKLVVDIYHQVVLAYTRDENGDYTVPERYMVCTSGGPQDPTPGGSFKAGTHRPRFGKFYNDGVYGQYWTQVVGKIYFHSLLYSERSAGTYTTSSYNRLGKRGSHGCIRLLVPDARWVYYHISPGATVEIRAGSKNDAETAAIKEQLVRAPLPNSRPQVTGLPNTDVWSIAELNEQLQNADSYALADGTVVRPYGDEYSNGRLVKFGKLSADGH